MIEKTKRASPAKDDQDRPPLGSLEPVAFSAIIKKLEVKTLCSCDKGGTLVLEFDNPSDDLISAINRIHRPDEQIIVALKRIGE
jgi:hypothetical protein